MIARRSFLLGLGAMFAAPAVVRAASLMPVRNPPLIVEINYEAGFGGLLSVDAILQQIWSSYALRPDRLVCSDSFYVTAAQAGLTEFRGDLKLEIAQALMEMP